MEDVRTRTQIAADKAAQKVADKMVEVKPKLRGWIHSGMIPILSAAFAVLIAKSPTPITVVGSSIYAASALLLFGISGIYHRYSWNPTTMLFFRRFDHANIYIFIAGTYTPLAFLYLHGASRWVLFGVVWGCALAGTIFKMLMPDAPRWISTPLYVAMGWIAVFFLGQWIDGSAQFPGWVNACVLILVATGGILYTLGAVVYALKRPNPIPGWFGFHEVFHAFTAVAFICQYVAVSMATYSLPA